MSRLRQTVHEFHKTLELAIPIILFQVGFLLLNLVDTYIVGKVSPQNIAGAGMGLSFFAFASTVGFGILSSLDYLISESLGAKNHRQAHSYLIQGIYLATLLSIPLGIVVYFGDIVLTALETAPTITRYAKPFLEWSAYGVLPSMLFVVFQKYWQSRKRITPLIIMIFAVNILNYCADSIFVLGTLYTPWFSIGTFSTPDLFKNASEAVGMVTFLSRTFLLGLMVLFTLYEFRHETLDWAWDRIKQINILKIGLPAGFQFSLEFGFFFIVTLMVSQLGAIPTAAHHIVLTLASFTFMFPLGLSFACAVQVGTLVGEKKFVEARTSGWSAIGVSVLMMTLTGLSLYFFSRPLLEGFTQDLDVIRIGQKLLLVAAAFQIFDGIQVTGAGALRGIGETKVSAAANLIGYYPIGLVSVYFFTHVMDYGVQGAWYGLVTGLAAVSILILMYWRSKSLHLALFSSADSA